MLVSHKHEHFINMKMSFSVCLSVFLSLFSLGAVAGVPSSEANGGGATISVRGGLHEGAISGVREEGSSAPGLGGGQDIATSYGRVRHGCIELCNYRKSFCGS